MKKNNKAELEALREEMKKVDRSGPSFENAQRLIINKDGKYRVRLLPSNASDSKAPFRLYKLHYYKNPNFPDSDKQAPFVCIEKGCPMCQKAFTLLNKEKQENTPREQREAWKKFAQTSAVYYVLDLNDNTVKQMSVDKGYNGIGLHDLILQEINVKIDEGVNVLDPEDGRVLVIERRTIDGKKRYTVNFEDDSHEIDEATLLAAKKLKPLNRLYWTNTAEELKKVLLGEPWIDKEGKSGKKAVTEEESLFDESFDDESEDDDISDLKRNIFDKHK